MIKIPAVKNLFIILTAIILLLCSCEKKQSGNEKETETKKATITASDSDTSDTTNLYPSDAVWTAPMMVIINGEEYKYVTEYKGTESTDNIEILGEVKKHVSIADYDWPTEEGTSNFAAVGAKYGRLGDKMLVQYENTWVIIDNY